MWCHVSLQTRAILLGGICQICCCVGILQENTDIIHLSLQERMFRGVIFDIERMKQKAQAGQMSHGPQERRPRKARYVGHMSVWSLCKVWRMSAFCHVATLHVCRGVWKPGGVLDALLDASHLHWTVELNWLWDFEIWAISPNLEGKTWVMPCPLWHWAHVHSP